MSGSTAMVLVAILHGCGGSDGASSADSAVVGDDCATDTGRAAPSWEPWAADFFATWCQSCHATDTPQRYGAPLNVVFDTEADAISHAATIRRTVIDQSSMPIGGGLEPQDIVLLEAWLCMVEAR